MLALRKRASVIGHEHFEEGAKAVVPSGNRRDQVKAVQLRAMIGRPIDLMRSAMKVSVEAVTWDSIGGLEDVKHKLQQVMLTSCIPASNQPNQHGERRLPSGPCSIERSLPSSTSSRLGASCSMDLLVALRPLW